ncbi:MAG: ABC transporter permease [Pedobacter sp.]|nr:MAG: ABC transporter permease [Pedobacter sp.]
MRSLYISLISEFYKSRKTLAFWAAILLPVIICTLVSFGFYSNADKVLPLKFSGLMLWARYSKNDTWKTLFAQPLNKFSIYAAKYLFAVLLIFICLFLFAALTFGFGYILQTLIPKYTFNQYNPTTFLFNSYAKLFLSSLGILSLQFILSLIWADFLKPMGIGFVGTIMGIVTASLNWKFAYLIPYSLPTLALQLTKVKKGGDPLAFEVFSREIYTSLIFAAVFFVIGYFIVSKKSIK